MHQAESVLPRARIAYNRRMKILLNGAEREVAASTSLAELLEQAGYGARRVAVEVNREIIPRSRHAAQRLDDGDRIEIVHAIGGG
jgi:sulfur carrier protein